MVELLKPKQPIDSRKQPIVCFGTITEKWFFCFDWALNVLTDYAPVFKSFDQSLNAINKFVKIW